MLRTNSGDDQAWSRDNFAHTVAVTLGARAHPQCAKRPALGAIIQLTAAGSFRITPASAPEKHKLIASASSQAT